MKKNIFTTTLATLGILALAMPTLAAASTASFSPSAIAVAPGQTFNLVISVDPQGAKDYTEKVGLNFPAGVLEVKSFTLGDNWMALSQSGYDSVDNTKGVLVKTAGYPGGISSATTFGTVSFYAKEAGTGNITFGNDSVAFQINSQSVLTGTPASFAITAPTAPASPRATGNNTPATTGGTATTVAAPQNQNPAQQATTTGNETATPAANNESNTAPVVQQNGQQSAAQPAGGASLLAGAGGILTLRSGNTLVSILTVLVVLAA